MNKHISLLLTFVVMLFLFSGCVQRELVLEDSSSAQSQDNTWGDEENIDISDLDDDNTTESETVITEDALTQKMERIPFPASEYNHLPRSGKGTVKGKIFVKDAYGQRILGKGTRLYLNPVTSYSEQWYEESYLGGNKMQKADSRLFNYLRFTASNTEGAFAFYGVPTGSYYLIGTVKCGNECGYDTPKSIRIATRVNVQGNQVVQKDLSRYVE
ncbi:MAG TPA: carboxypeptidase regulatory-like domain-containing protein [Sulfurovum sp.]|nr:carboxypeptidase regulatory-like domain-containing protein [Sulfurovum sp.]